MNQNILHFKLLFTTLNTVRSLHKCRHITNMEYQKKIEQNHEETDIYD